jgi:hypothetical protein
MSEFQLPGGTPFQPFEPGREPSEAGVLRPELLEHGAYYAGKIGAVSAIARWHARKQRFVFGQFNFGRHRVTSIPHVAEKGTGERFAPISKTGPTDTSRVSDYAFESAA